jgi:hypothetical protein
MADNLGVVTALTVITPIIPEKLETLKQVLASIQANPSATIAKISTIHFARWVIIDNGTRLLFTSNFDGSWEAYLQDFVREMPDGLDFIWSNCEGYPGSIPFQGFADYVKAHQFSNNTFYAAYPDLTVQAVLNAKEWRDAGRTLVPALQDYLTKTA